MRRTALPALILAAAAAALPAGAVGTHGISVAANVISGGNCRFNTAGPTALAFGALDPSIPGDKTATASIVYRCTAGTPTVTWAVTSDHGQHETGPGAPRMRHAVDLARFLKYTLSFPASGTSPRNTNLNLVVNGTIAEADLQAAAAGNYADTVVLTIAP